MKAQRGSRGTVLHSLLTSVPDGGELSTPRPGRCTPGKEPVPIVHEDGWAPGLVWTSAEISPPAGFNLWTVQLVASRYTNYATVFRPTWKYT